MAMMPRPASRPAVPPSAAPTPAPGPAADGSWMRALSSQTYLLAIRLMSELAMPELSRSSTTWRAWP